MVNNFAEERRKNKIKFQQFIESHSNLPMEQIICKFSYETGYKKTTLDAWCEELIGAGVIKVKNNG